MRLQVVPAPKSGATERTDWYRSWSLAGRCPANNFDRLNLEGEQSIPFSLQVRIQRLSVDADVTAGHVMQLINITEESGCAGAVKRTTREGRGAREQTRKNVVAILSAQPRTGGKNLKKKQKQAKKTKRKRLHCMCVCGGVCVYI